MVANLKSWSVTSALIFLSICLPAYLTNACFITDCPHSLGKRNGGSGGLGPVLSRSKSGSDVWKYPQVKCLFTTTKIVRPLICFVAVPSLRAARPEWLPVFWSQPLLLLREGLPESEFTTKSRFEDLCIRGLVDGTMRKPRGALHFRRKWRTVCHFRLLLQSPR